MKALVSAEVHVRARRLIVRLLALGAAGALAVALMPAAAIAAPAAPAAAGGDWTQFRNGPAHQGYNAQENVLSPSNVDALGVAWTADTGFAIYSSPAVADGVVYVGSMNGVLYAFSVDCAKDGGTCTPLWKAFAGTLITSSPAVADGVVYVGSYNGKLYAYAVGCAKDGGTCTPLWTAATGGAIFSSPTVADGVVYVGSLDGKLYAYAVGCAKDGGSCKPLWTAATGGVVYSSPAVADGVVYVGSGSGKLSAFAVDCAKDGGSCKPLWTATTGGIVASSPAVAEGVVYVGSGDGLLYAYAVGCASDGKSCKSLWTATTDGYISSSPAVADGVVYIGSGDRNLYAFPVGCATGGETCTPLWTAKVGDYIGASPAVANGVVYISAANGKVEAYAVGCASGGAACTPLWTVTTDSAVYSSPVVANGALYVGSFDGKLYSYVLNLVGRVLLSPGNATIAVGKSQAYTAAGLDANGKLGDVTSETTFAISDGGSCTGASCTAASVGDYTVTGTRGSTTGTVTLHVEAYVATTYHPISPARVLDTRASGGSITNIGLTGAFTDGTVRTFHVANAPYVGGGAAVAVPAEATAVTGNLTIVNKTGSGVVALGPTMTPTGDVTTLNFAEGDIRANNVSIGLASDGTLQAVFRSTTPGATTALIFDVTGYFTPDTTGATYHAVSPGRILDTSPTGDVHTNIGLAGKFDTTVVRTFAVAGAEGLGWKSPLVPVGATAVTGNLTVTNATSDGYVSLGPTMVSAPQTSTVNIKQGANCANGVTVALDAGNLSAVWVGAAGSSADVIFDVTGFFTADASGLSYHPIIPARYLDSSKGKGLTDAFATGTPQSLTVGGVGAVPTNAVGISGNLTLVGPTSAGFAQVAPTISGTPTSSTLNAVAGQTVANGFDVPLDSSHKIALIWVGTDGSTAHMQLDVTGYWK